MRYAVADLISCLALALLVLHVFTSGCHGHNVFEASNRVMHNGVLGRLPPHGGGGPLGRDKLQEGVGTREKDCPSNSVMYTLPRSSTIHKAVSANLGGWAAIVAATYSWAVLLPGNAAGVLEVALFVAVAASSTLQVTANICASVAAQGLKAGRQFVSMVGLHRFQLRFLIVLFVATFAEFVQSANIYKVYTVRHGYGMDFYAKLSSASYVAATAAGLFVGALMDKYGRRKGCLSWALLNAFQCLLIRIPNNRVAHFTGRVMAGVSAALFTCAFECWMVTEQHRQGFPPSSLPETFRLLTWVGGIVPILSGIVSGKASRMEGWGEVAAFDLSAGASLLTVPMILNLWGENYGDRRHSAVSHVNNAVCEIVGSGGVVLLMGMFQSLSEAAFFAWVATWIPSVQGKINNFEGGTAFAALMASMSAGIALTKILTEALPTGRRFSPEMCLLLCSGVSCVTMGAMALKISGAHRLILFMVYEVCLGMFYPAMGTCREHYIGDKVRGTVMGLFRIPASLITAGMIMGVLGRGAASTPEELEHKVSIVFGMSALLLLLATAVQAFFVHRVEGLASKTRL